MQQVSLTDEKFLDPVLILNQLNIEKGQIIADFGCGPGYFTIPFSEKVGSDGIVYALDVLPQALETVQSRAKISGITNIFLKRVNLERENGSGLASSSIDVVIMKDLLFQNNNKKGIAAEAKRILKKGGKVLVIEWNDNDLGFGPDESMRIKKNDLIEIFQTIGFKKDADIDCGAFHYGMLFSR